MLPPLWRRSTNDSHLSCPLVKGKIGTHCPLGEDKCEIANGRSPPVFCGELAVRRKRIEVKSS